MTHSCCRLHVKEEAADYLQPDTIRNLVKKYSQFINFPIYLWASRTETVEESDADGDDKTDGDADDDAQVCVCTSAAAFPIWKLKTFIH